MDVAVAGVDNEFEKRVADALLPGTRLVPCSMSNLEGEGASDFAAIILGPDIPLLAAIERAKAVDAEHPETPVVLVAPHDPKILREALLAGARDVWNPGLDQHELATSLARVLETSRHRSGLAVLRRAVDPSEATNKVIAVLAAKGGVGQTLVATNLARGLAARNELEVAVVDLDVQFGDVAAFLRLMPEHDVAEAVAAVDNIPALKTMFADHSSGLHALCAPEDIALADTVDADRSGRLMDVVSSQFDVTVVDVGDGLEEHALSVLDHATAIVVVATPDPFVVKDTQRMLRVLDLITGDDTDKRLVLNHATDRTGFRPADVEEILSWEIDVEIATTRSIRSAAVRGEAMFTGPRGPRRAIHQLMDLVAGSAPADRPGAQR